MPRLNDNYYLRKCFLEEDQVPTQSVIKQKMGPALANVYFKSMTPKLKILAGLEPSMKGGGSDWYMPPKDALEGRAILKPLKKVYLSKLGYNGIIFYGEKFVENYRKQMELEKERILLENDLNWEKSIEASCRQQWEAKSKAHSQFNTSKIKRAFLEFETLYRTSITKIERIMFDAANKQIEHNRDEAFRKMSKHYETLLKQQATMLYDRYEEKLNTEKQRLKAEFINNVETSRTKLGNDIHDINVEKHVAVEKLRSLLERQNLACQVYVALKERGEFNKEVEIKTHKHEKAMKFLKEQAEIKDVEIKLAKEKERQQREFNIIWKKKICHVVKRLQDFIQYSLCNLPEHAEFFINMEKLMLLQLSEAFDNPSTESIIVSEDDQYHPPLPKPHPFYIFCDKGYKPELQDNLCPKHCTSSASQLPVVVVNKRYIYAACDNLPILNDKVQRFIDGQRGDDNDFIDDHDYTYDIPFKHTSSQEIKQLKLESSIMQILQNEYPNVQGVQTEYCTCSPIHSSDTIVEKLDTLDEEQHISSCIIESVNKICSPEMELMHQREPKLGSYMNYILPNCKCAKKAKKHLEEHLPPYMRLTSKYDSPNLLNYETCNMNDLKKLVRRARGIRSPTSEPDNAEPRTKNVSTQYSDNEFDYLCTCLADDEVDNVLRLIMKGSKLFGENAASEFEIVDRSISHSHLDKSQSAFAKDAAYSLRHLIHDSPELEEIFIKNDCKY